MSDHIKHVEVEEIDKRIISDVTDICPTDGITGGVAITGFIDVEKLIHIKKGCHGKKTIFLEKKLPFSYLMVSLDPSEEEHEL
ncbi:MAG: hypothetical protein Q8936_06865 [Bacillota bacterium]|nr:hypothetical protein [Bacillota bacterium]